MAHTTHNKDGAAQPSELKPEFIRPKDVPRIFGLGRSSLYILLSQNRIKSVSMRKRGQRHAARLISYDSLKNYLESLAEGGES